MTLWERYKLVWRRHLPFYRVIGPLMVLFGLVRIYPLISFWVDSKEAMGTVIEVTAVDGMCERSGKNDTYGSHQCTKFNALIEFKPQFSDQNLKINIDAGHEDGSNNSVELANVKKRDLVDINYNLKTRKVYTAKQLYNYVPYYSFLVFFGLFLSIAGYWKFLKRKPPVDLTSGT